MGSRGSVIPFFLSLAEQGVLPITDIRMTRFMITLQEAVELVWDAFSDMEGGEIYVKKIPSMKVIDIAKAIAPNAKHKIIGIRPGEKIHEQMIGVEDAENVFSYENYYKILPMIYSCNTNSRWIKNGHAVPKNFKYSSDDNDKWMSIEDLNKAIKNKL
jgi:FlaA1/EpsC-like NDP-sugar epimerase